MLSHQHSQWVGVDQLVRIAFTRVEATLCLASAVPWYQRYRRQLCGAISHKIPYFLLPSCSQSLLSCRFMGNGVLDQFCSLCPCTGAKGTGAQYHLVCHFPLHQVSGLSARGVSQLPGCFSGSSRVRQLSSSPTVFKLWVFNYINDA